VSLCWAPHPTGVFQPAQAIAILDQVLEFLQRKSVGFEP